MLRVDDRDAGGEPGCDSHERQVRMHEAGSDVLDQTAESGDGARGQSPR